MRGGYQILDLRGLNIQPNDTEVSITDEYVLEQLLKIGDFIDDEAGLIANQLKPINVLLPATSGYANLSLLEAGTLLIDIMVLGGHFVLTVVYGTVQDDYGNWVKYVDSAEYSYTELESGSKLYIHEFKDNANKAFTVMLASSIPITSSGTTFLNELRLGAILGNQATTLLYLQYQGSNTLVGKTRNNSDFTFNTENYTDTVTEL